MCTSVYRNERITRNKLTANLQFGRSHFLQNDVNFIDFFDKFAKYCLTDPLKIKKCVLQKMAEFILETGKSSVKTLLNINLGTNKFRRIILVRAILFVFLT